MRNTYCITIVSFFMMSYLFGQDTAALKPKKYKILRYYKFGLYGYGCGEEKCEREISLKYGFVNIEKAGCEVSRGQQRRWNRHNNRITKKLQARHWEGWRDKYLTEINQCCKK
jgi:hypothetical protein